MEFLSIIGLVVAIFASLAFQQYLLGIKMSEPEKMFGPISGGLDEYQIQTITQHANWLKSVNLEFQTSYQFGNIQVALFQESDRPRFFSFCFLPAVISDVHGIKVQMKPKRITFSADTCWDNLTVLETSNSGYIGLLPRPGAYAQNFPNISADDLWARHLEGEEHLTKKFGYAWESVEPDYKKLLLSAMRVRMAHNRSQSFWPFRVVYRYFVTRHFLVNRSIMRQFPLTIGTASSFNSGHAAPRQSGKARV